MLLDFLFAFARAGSGSPKPDQGYSTANHQGRPTARGHFVDLKGSYQCQRNCGNPNSENMVEPYRDNQKTLMDPETAC